MAWLNFAILIVAIVFVLFALVSLLQAIQARARVANAAYGVGRQESRRSMLVALLRMAIFGVLALILFGVYGLSARPEEVLLVEPDGDLAVPATATSERLLATVGATATDEPQPATSTATLAAPVVAATETLSPETPTSEPSETPTITPTSPPSAIVTSEVGLYLRERPGGTQEVELLPVGATLILLDGSETVDGVEWREVRAPSGQEGWVAIDFIELQQ